MFLDFCVISLIYDWSFRCCADLVSLEQLLFSKGVLGSFRREFEAILNV